MCKDCEGFYVHRIKFEERKKPSTLSNQLRKIEGIVLQRIPDEEFSIISFGFGSKNYISKALVQFKDSNNFLSWQAGSTVLKKAKIERGEGGCSLSFSKPSWLSKPTQETSHDTVMVDSKETLERELSGVVELPISSTDHIQDKTAMPVQRATCISTVIHKVVPSILKMVIRIKGEFHENVGYNQYSLTNPQPQLGQAWKSNEDEDVFYIPACTSLPLGMPRYKQVIHYHEQKYSDIFCFSLSQSFTLKSDQIKSIPDSDIVKVGKMYFVPVFESSEFRTRYKGFPSETSYFSSDVSKTWLVIEDCYYEDIGSNVFMAPNPQPNPISFKRINKFVSLEHISGVSGRIRHGKNNLIEPRPCLRRLKLVNRAFYAYHGTSLLTLLNPQPSKENLIAVNGQFYEEMPLTSSIQIISVARKYEKPADPLQAHRVSEIEKAMKPKATSQASSIKLSDSAIQSVSAELPSSESLEGAALSSKANITIPSVDNNPDADKT
jgi:hypothetical protein